MVVIPAELIYIIADFVLADRDPSTLKACSFAFRHLRLVFQRALLAKRRVLLFCEPKDDERGALLAGILRADPSFGCCITDLHISLSHIEDTRCSTSVGSLLSKFTHVRRLSLADGGREGSRWYSLGGTGTTLAAVVELVRLGTLKTLALEGFSAGWPILLAQRKNLDCLVLTRVRNLYHIGRGEDDEGAEEYRSEQEHAPIIRHLEACLISARGVFEATQNNAAPGKGHMIDLSHMRTFETSFDYENENVGDAALSETRRTRVLEGLKMLLRREDVTALTTLVIKLKGFGRQAVYQRMKLFRELHPPCFQETLENLVFDAPAYEYFAEMCYATYITNSLDRSTTLKAVKTITFNVTFLSPCDRPGKISRINVARRRHIKKTWLKLLFETLTEEKFPRLNRLSLEVSIPDRDAYDHSIEDAESGVTPVRISEDLEALRERIVDELGTRSLHYRFEMNVQCKSM